MQVHNLLVHVVTWILFLFSNWATVSSV